MSQSINTISDFKNEYQSEDENMPKRDIEYWIERAKPILYFLLQNKTARFTDLYRVGEIRDTGYFSRFLKSLIKNNILIKHGKGIYSLNPRIHSEIASRYIHDIIIEAGRNYPNATIFSLHEKEGMAIYGLYPSLIEKEDVIELNKIWKLLRDKLWEIEYKQIQKLMSEFIQQFTNKYGKKAEEFLKKYEMDDMYVCFLLASVYCLENNCNDDENRIKEYLKSVGKGNIISKEDMELFIEFIKMFIPYYNSIPFFASLVFYNIDTATAIVFKDKKLIPIEPPYSLTHINPASIFLLALANKDDQLSRHLYAQYLLRKFLWPQNLQIWENEIEKLDLSKEEKEEEAKIIIRYLLAVIEITKENPSIQKSLKEIIQTIMKEFDIPKNVNTIMDWLKLDKRDDKLKELIENFAFLMR